jgi:hypothetical protein
MFLACALNAGGEVYSWGSEYGGLEDGFDMLGLGKVPCLLSQIGESSDVQPCLSSNYLVSELV